MRPLRTRLQRHGPARRSLVRPERDYLLSWVLAGIAHVPVLQEKLVFKAALRFKKCYFGDYRFSEDLDFSALEGVPTGAALDALVGEACRAAERLLDEYAPVRLTHERYEERQPHPAGQEAFNVRAQFPWQPGPQTRVMIEVTMDERVLRPPEERPIIHDYEEPLGAAVRVYSLEEIVAEKLRAILQQAAARRERGWSRSRARDHYDLWRVLGSYGGRMDLTGFDALLREKCAPGSRVRGAGGLPSREMLADVARTCNSRSATRAGSAAVRRDHRRPPAAHRGPPASHVGCGRERLTGMTGRLLKSPNLAGCATATDT